MSAAQTPTDPVERHIPRLPWFVVFLARRAVWALITLFFYISFLFFFVQWWVPYNAATQAARFGAYEETLHALGLDRPLPVRYWEFLTGLAHGQLGVDVTQTLPTTLFIFAVGAVFAYLIGDYLGRVGAWRRNRALSGTTSLVGVLSITIFPPFLVFVMVWLLIGPLYDLLQLLGNDVNNAPLWYQAPFTQSQVFVYMTLAVVAAVAVALVVRGYARRKRHWVTAALSLPVMLVAGGVGLWWGGVGRYGIDLLFRYGQGVFVGRGTPVLALVGFVLIAFGQVLFMVRVSFEDERSEDYALTAWAKGLTNREIRDVHIARNAMGPALAASFLTIPTVLAGMIVVESELQLQGLATQFFNALHNQDIPTMMGILVVLGLFGVGLRIAVDVVTAVLDPRQRIAEI
ncbi:MAG: ABC transporter permease [Acidimicrobiia bacterium]